MNVLIVLKDKSLNNWLCNALEKSVNVEMVKCISTRNDFEKFFDSTVLYDVCFFGIDDFESYILDIPKHFNCNNLIGFSYNSKKIIKYINADSFERIFKQPLNVVDLVNYCNKRFNLFKKKNDIEYSEDNCLKLLASLGFNVSHNGTLYLAESIELANENKYLDMKGIFEKVGKANKTRGCNVSWAVYNSVDSAYSNDRTHKLDKFFKIYDGRKPTPKLIIDYFVKLGNS